MTVAGTVLSKAPLVGDALRWLRAETTAPECVPERRDATERYIAAAAARVRVARDLAQTPAIAAGVMRDAVVLFARAALAARGGDADDDALPDALAQLEGAAGRAASDDARHVSAAIRSRDLLYFDSLSPADLAAAQEALYREAQWLQGQVDLRSPAYRAGLRIGRHAALAILVLWLGYAIVGKAFAPRNLAIGRPVRASTHEPGTPEPSAVVDGKIASTYGVHTQVSSKEPAWVVIDLGVPSDIRKIVVYNRSDRNFDDGLPYALDISTDGTTFHVRSRLARSPSATAASCLRRGRSRRTNTGDSCACARSGTWP